MISGSNPDNLEDEIINIPCHICNIDVPVPFLKQHVDSFKHTINMKIADMAVERLKKSMRHYNICDQESYPTLHFCPACVTVIKSKDKTKHEKSIAHRNSLLVDKFLNDFYLLYTNNTDCDGDDVKFNANTDDLNEFNYQDQRSNVLSDNFDRSLDSFSFKSVADSVSIFKESDHDNEKNKKNNDNIKRNEIKNKNDTSLNVKTTVEDSSNDIPSPKKEEIIKMKKAKAKNNADLIDEREIIQNVRQSSVSLSSSDMSREASKVDAEFIKVEKGKTKNKKKSNRVIQDDRCNDSLSFFADDVKEDDGYDKTENCKETKTNMNQDIVAISKEQNHIASTVEALSLPRHNITAQDASTNVIEVNKTKKSKRKQELLETSKQSKDNRTTGSLFIGPKEASTNVLDITKTAKNQTHGQINDTSAENNTNQDVLCKICNKNKDQDHSVCVLLWNEYCGRFDADDGIIDVITYVHYHLVMKGSVPYCMVCKCNFYGDIDVIDHLLSDEHINTYNMLLNEQDLVSDNEWTICRVCNITFKKELELLHCEEIKHITKYEKYKRQLSKSNA
ncbi:phosphatidylinositol 3-kinase 3-like isoform X2 [Vanessa cardui]|uniref:phosphatidylinositol 3-kinase 3-like isoform X2 n=1 Tax=Vanessa cardui TaxID=171605 RepID=UPI001F12A38F|nr:phosphatidylinositol 3-kinase 3-like isoform X2 [Vanessa cardui]XP_046976193.1 phosphatidylinositol 3-kinase 3-like isoform X2 [Vanessa cardui]